MSRLCAYCDEPAHLHFVGCVLHWAETRIVVDRMEDPASHDSGTFVEIRDVLLHDGPYRRSVVPEVPTGFYDWTTHSVYALVRQRSTGGWWLDNVVRVGTAYRRAGELWVFPDALPGAMTLIVSGIQ